MRAALAFALAFAFAAPLRAAELVAVRVGEHPEFTRVVFEFDVAGGYRIERDAEGDAPNVVRVTLDAESTGRRIESRSSGVASVSVEAGSPRSVARIDTRKANWPIKEMILTDPPRVVLDFMRPEPVVARAPAPRPAAPPAVAPPIAADEPVEPPAPEIAAPAVEEAAPVQATAAALPADDSSASEVGSPGAPPAGGSPDSEEAVADSANADAIAMDAETASDIPAAVGDADEPAPPDGTEVVAEELAADAASEVEVASTSPTAAPEASPSGSSMSIPGGSMGLLAAVMVVGLAVGFAIVRRRRPKASDVDVSTLFSDTGEADDRPVPKHDVVGATPREKPAAVRTPPPTPESPGAAPGIFDDELEEKEAMTMDQMDLTTGSAASEAPTQLGVDASMAGAGNSNIVRIIQDMERRIAHLEARLDESVEARQQLERQVSAQTEELRVQRAAIARTQRALRGLNRSDEEQATEPALRNPDTPPAS